MLKKLSLVAMMAVLSACSTSWKTYVPFMGDNKPVINLDKEQIDQKSYAVAYAATVQSYKGRINLDYDVNSFGSGVNDWYLKRILVPVEQIRNKLASGLDSQLHAYYSGVVFAADLQNNFSRLSKTCWSKIDPKSMTQGIYDAVIDLRKDKVRSDEDEYITKGSEDLLKVCK
ncbi:hypothetical protein [Pasteurella bettyae]|uniref:Putative lipoprotein n=1 Tax=Pasteurella bettyae CCUG 2042 TaxID=1095749 RepID=I3DBF3_9PAST|nr:hypothetical protein [Pasteurella bettyae]EIJ69046.1 putative lipoprotein [Pasteurella bettyae CCUG 2042]SUB22918.1 Uncharacterised protein [Pasteurella bettyae]